MMKQILTKIKEDANLVSKVLSDALGETDPDLELVFKSMRYSALETAGKRVRPFLTVEVARTLGGSDEAALPLAAAVEAVHTYSLIHDDLPCMDDDDERRGMPSNHKVYGEATALLAGDGLLTLAFSVITESDALTDNQKVNAVKLLSHFAGARGMIGGQQIDLLGEKIKLTELQHKKMNLLKTGALIKAAALMGCIAANADTSTYECIEKYAECIGLAFQVKDDILDIGEEDEKTTYLTFMSKADAEALVNELTEKAVKAVAPIPNSEVLKDTAEFLRDRTV